MITYNILQQSRNYSSKVMEKNGMEIGIDVTINYNPMQNNCAKLHLKHGKAFESSFIDAKVRGVIKDVIGRYTYEEIYSTKREALETEMETIFQAEFPANYIAYNFCEIADVNLPENVKIAITEKETQKQRNQKAKELEEEQQYLANAEIKKAEGEKTAAILRAQGRAEEIRLVQQQLTRSPNYIELVKWKGYADGKGSPYGQVNVFGAGTSVIKGLKCRCDKDDVVQKMSGIIAGDRVKIERGPFSDFICNVEEIADNKRAWILIDLLQKQTRTEIALTELSKIK